jgi:hypothetical protein
MTVAAAAREAASPAWLKAMHTYNFPLHIAIIPSGAPQQYTVLLERLSAGGRSSEA